MEHEGRYPLFLVTGGATPPRWLEEALKAGGSAFSVTGGPENLPDTPAIVFALSEGTSVPSLPDYPPQVKILVASSPLEAHPGNFDAVIETGSAPRAAVFNAFLRLAARTLECKRDLARTLEKVHSLAEANREAAVMMEQIEEKDRRIAEQARELEERARSLARANAEAGRAILELEERDRQIRQQAEQIKQYHESLQRELRLARTLQMSLLPDTKPPRDDVILAERFVPATELCGDYYDYIIRPDGSFDIAVADVTGHGVASALVSVQVRALTHIYSLEGLEPAEILAKLNRFIHDNFGKRFLMTMFVLRVAPEGGVTYAGAGHNPFLLLDRGASAVTPTPSQTIPLGIMPDQRFEQNRITPAPGDRLLLYTDGLVEAANALEEPFGMERLKNALLKTAEEQPAMVVDSLLREVQYFTEKSLPFDDDVTVVLMERRR